MLSTRKEWNDFFRERMACAENFLQKKDKMPLWIGNLYILSDSPCRMGKKRVYFACMEG